MLRFHRAQCATIALAAAFIFFSSNCLQAQALDFSLYAEGARVVVQGGALHLNVGSNLISGTPNPNLDGVAVELQNLPPGVSYRFPGIDAGGCCGTAPNYWVYGVGTGNGLVPAYLKLQTSAQTPAGTYTITIKGTAIAEGVVRTYPLTIQVIAASDTTLPPPVFSTSVAVPMKAQWETNMTTWGEKFCNQSEIASMGIADASVWFYDGERVFYQIGDYTKNSRWAACSQYVESVYQPYLIQNKGNVTWYSVFTRGFRMDYEKTGDALSYQALNLMGNADPYKSPNTAADPQYMRENAYALQAALDQEALTGVSQSPVIDDLMEAMLGQLDQIFITRKFTWYQPFMVGLASEALIQYFEQKRKDPRIPYYLKRTLDGMWNQAWVAPEGGFSYRCYQDGCYLPNDNSVYPPNPPYSYPAYSNLNLLVAPAFAWLYLQTGDPLYRQRGDTVFANGVQLQNGSFYRGKEFSQNYRWSFEYVKWREQANALAPTTALSDTQAPTVAVSFPLSQSTVSGSIQMVATATDNTNVKGVQFLIDGAKAAPPVLDTLLRSSLETTQLTNGQHTITAIAFDDAGNSGVSAPVTFYVNNPVHTSFQSCPQASIPTGSFQGCYYNVAYDPALNNIYRDVSWGNVALTRNDAAIDFDWPARVGPAAGIQSGFFGVLWQGKFNLQAGQYTFHISRTEGMRLYIDSQMVVDGWWPQTAIPSSFKATFLDSGVRQIRVEYWRGYDNVPASVHLSWSPDFPTSTPGTPVINAPVVTAPSAITVTSNPAGLPLQVDGATCTAPCAVNWTAGSSHSVSAGSLLNGADGVRYQFNNWSDGGAASHTIVAPSSPTAYTAAFTPQYYVTAAASPAGSGSVSPSYGWFNSGSTIHFTASPAAGYSFSNYSGLLTGSSASQTLTVSAPGKVQANFTQGSSSSGGSTSSGSTGAGSAVTAITSNPAGLPILVDGASCVTPCSFTWPSGSSHTVAARFMLYGANGVRSRFNNWSDGGSATHTITAPSSSTSIAASYTTQFYLNSVSVPASGGYVAPPFGWFDSGSTITVTAYPNPGSTFAEFSGVLTGSSASQRLVVSGPGVIQANFR